jgi:beta-mannosidase
VTLRAVNDTMAPVELSLWARAVSMDGISQPVGEARQSVPTDAAVDLLFLPSSSIQAGEVLAFTWAGADEVHQGGDVYAPRPWKSYDLRPSGLTAKVTPEGGLYHIGLTVEALAPFVAVEADVPGRFSANAVTLFPGHPATLTFIPSDPKAAPVFTYRDLYAATYGPQD